MAILHTIEYNNLQPTKIPQQVTTNTISQSIQSKDKVVQTNNINKIKAIINNTSTPKVKSKQQSSINNNIKYDTKINILHRTTTKDDSYKQCPIRNQKNSIINENRNVTRKKSKQEKSITRNNKSKEKIDATEISSRHQRKASKSEKMTKINILRKIQHNVRSFKFQTH